MKGSVLLDWLSVSNLVKKEAAQWWYLVHSGKPNEGTASQMQLFDVGPELVCSL
jgi:hypothetical protein